MTISSQDNNYLKVVCMGGGTGLSAVLRGMKKLPVDITAIVTVADDGGSSGRLREDLRMPPPGDIRNVLLSLADTEPLLEKVFQYRFKHGAGLQGHTLGNLMIAAMKEITGDFTQAVKELSRVLAVRGLVLPASEQDVTLLAEMEDGTIIQGESQIPLSGKKIKRVFLHPPDPKPLEEAITAIKRADAIIIGPGSLYTSILPTILVKDMAKVISGSKACKIYICNVMTQPGETDGFVLASKHIETIYDHIKEKVIDIVLTNNQLPPPEIRMRYLDKHQQLVLSDRDSILQYGCEVIEDNFLSTGAVIRHDTDRICTLILELLLSRRKYDKHC